MPRNGSGTYTLPSGNPVVAGTTIESSWANTTLNDVATEMTGSLSRAGSGGMTGPLRLDAGTAAVPALAWSTETTTGLYRAGTNDVRLAVATSDVMRWQAAGVSVTGTLGVSGAVTLSGGTANGVLYLNGSQVASSGSALTFDGTNFATTGTSSATKLIPTGGSATGNGMYLPATNALAWSNNGVETMRLDASGNLGIGTASPNARLVVQQANNTADGIRLFANGSDTQLITRYVASIDAWQITANFASTGAYKPITWWTSDLERMRLDASGNLGLGVTPSAWESTCRMLQLGAVGTVGRANSGQTQLGFNYFINSSGQYVYIQSLHATRHEQISGEHRWFNAASGTAGNVISFTQAMTLDASGNLGIGTASPGAKLEVYGGASGTVTNIQAGNASTGFQFGIDASNNCQVRTSQNVPILFYTNATQRMQISADGNVLIGTAALATTATAGFPWIPSCAGVPTGAPAAPYTNAAAMVVDTTNNRLYVRVGSTWRYATLT